MDLHMFPSEGYQPHENVDLMTAIDRYTIGGAFASFEETMKGRLMDGYVADLVVLDQPIFEMDPLQLKDVSVVMTMVDGKIVYQKG
jgi:predicted amidohydrolase YtcJ